MKVLADGSTFMLNKIHCPKTRQEVFKILADQMHNFAPGVFAVLTSSSSGLQIKAGDHVYLLNDKERAIAQWAYDNGQIAGNGTDNLPAGRGYYIPLKTPHMMIFGIMAFVFDKPEEALTPENKEIFETMAFLGLLRLKTCNIKIIRNQVEASFICKLISVYSVLPFLFKII